MIGKEIFIVRRPSLPNIFNHNESSLREFAADVKGDFIPVAESRAGGYVVFQSGNITKRSGHSSSK